MIRPGPLLSGARSCTRGEQVPQALVFKAGLRTNVLARKGKRQVRSKI